MKYTFTFLLFTMVISGFAQGSGEVIITEIYNRPLKPTQEQLDVALPNNPNNPDIDLDPDEGHTEWFEIYNTTDAPVVMDNWTIQDASAASRSSVIESFTLAAKSYAVFAGFNIPEAHGGVVFDYFFDYEMPSFNNESSYADAGDSACPDGVILLNSSGDLVDEAVYDYGYGEYIGNADSPDCMDQTEAVGIPPAGSSSRVSIMLLPDEDAMTSAANDLSENWTYSTLTYDADGGQIGTPGLANDGSTGTGGAAGTGEVIITEIYNRPLKPTEEELAAALPNNPAGADTTPDEGHTEWFEVYNTTDEDIDMDGWTLTDGSSSSRVSTVEDYVLPANSYAVFSGFDIPEAHGGIQFDYFYDYEEPSFNNESSYADEGDTACPDGVIIQKEDGTLVDQVTYDYGYGNYIGNEDAGSCNTNTEVVGIPGMNSSSRISFALLPVPSAMTSAGNDIATNWIFSSNVYDTEGDFTQKGTPGFINDAVSSAKDEFIASQFAVYPNPTNDVLFLQTDLQGNYSVKVVDLQGKVMMNTRTNTQSINVAGLTNGIYLLNINYEGDHATKKFSVVK